MDTRDVEPLTYSARFRRLLDLGRAAAAGDRDAAALLADLRQSPDPYCRLLHLASTCGSRDGAAVLDAIGDPSRRVRRLAVRLAPVLCDDAQTAMALLRTVDQALLRRLLFRLRRRRRVALVDGYLTERLSRGRDPRAIDLLPYASAETVQAQLRWVQEGGSPLTWTRIATFYPALGAAELQRQISATGAPDPRLRWRIVPLLSPLATRAPDEALKIVRLLFSREMGLVELHEVLRLLLQKRTRETFDLLRTRHEQGAAARPPGAFSGLSFDAVAHRLGSERLCYLVRHGWSTLSDGAHGRRWYLRLSQQERQEVLRTWLAEGRGAWGAFLLRHVEVQNAAREPAFSRWSHAAQAQDGSIAPEALDWLPRDLREREARRHLFDLADLASKPERRLPYARFLPFGEAQDFLRPWTGHPEGAERGRALRTLIACAQHQPEALFAVLAAVRARRNEQDPVRLQMIKALCALPVRYFKKEHMEGVSGVVQEALDAADLSGSTAAAVERLVVRLFRVDGGWGARWLTRLLEVRGAVSTQGLGEGLTRKQVRVLAPALTELAATWATRERAGALITLAQSLGVRLGEVEPLLDALERMASGLPFIGVAAAALGLLKARARGRFAELVPQLLATDRSFLLLSAVAQHVSLQRQDLLGPLLSLEPMTGRFATGRTHWVIDFITGHGRWTSGQQRAYAAGLLSLVREDLRDVPAARFALSTLALLAFADPAPLLSLAGDPRPPVREMAVRALPWLDGGQGVPVLIECLGDDRARHAIYALRKAFSEMARDRVLAQLRAVPMGKVTVAKEVVRLLGEMGDEDAYGDLLALDRKGQQPGQPLHRDVRIALLRALWDHLEREETWAVFDRAAADPDWVLASHVADVPLSRLSAAAEDRMVDLLSRVLSRPEPEARLDLLGRASGLPLRDASRALFRRLLVHAGTDHPAEAAAALDAVLLRMLPGEAAEVAARLTQLLPRRRLMVTLLPVLLQRQGPYAPAPITQVIRALLPALRDDPLAVTRYLEVAGRVLPFKELGPALIDLSARDLLHADAMVAALGAVRACVHPELLEQQLRPLPDGRLRRLALCALEQAAAPQQGWTQERRERLLAYRRDRDPLVAGAASFLFPPE